MKAAVLNVLGEAPVYADFPDPVVSSSDELILHVKAAAVKNLDKLRASGTHYASYTEVPVVVGIDGVGELADGRLVYAQGLTGMIADKALIHKDRFTPLPENIDLNLAAALPNAVIGATMALKARAKMQKGAVVLVNGATGVTGQLAVQVAKYYGASEVIVTGRNTEVLESLKDLGADSFIQLNTSDEEFIADLKAIHSETPIDIVIDYIWGHPMELIIKALKGGGIHSFTTKVKIVTVGDMAGKTITLDSATLRSSDIEILGSGLGSLSEEDIQSFNKEILPEMFELAANGKLKLPTHVEQLSDIAKVWTKTIDPGMRLVIRI